jgi:hypothetical protein
MGLLNCEPARQHRETRPTEYHTTGHIRSTNSELDGRRGQQRWRRDRRRGRLEVRCPTRAPPRDMAVAPFPEKETVPGSRIRHRLSGGGDRMLQRCCGCYPTRRAWRGRMRGRERVLQLVHSGRMSTASIYCLTTSTPPEAAAFAARVVLGVCMICREGRPRRRATTGWGPQGWAWPSVP